MDISLREYKWGVVISWFWCLLSLTLCVFVFCRMSCSMCKYSWAWQEVSDLISSMGETHAHFLFSLSLSSNGFSPSIQVQRHICWPCCMLAADSDNITCYKTFPFLPPLLPLGSGLGSVCVRRYAIQCILWQYNQGTCHVLSPLIGRCWLYT